MGSLEFRLHAGRLTKGAGGMRILSKADRQAFARWIDTYHVIARGHGQEAALLALGCEIAAWLDGSERWLAQWRQADSAPLMPIFATGKPPDEAGRQFLEVPWELAAEGTTHLVADPNVIWTPLRRIGPADRPPEPIGEFRLSTLFMAAAPLGVQELDFEQEEKAILQATEGAGLDLHVEDSGMLEELAQHWSRIGPADVLHLSCHGTEGDPPALVLEGPGGERQDANLADLTGEFNASWPRLLFVSACHSGQSGADLSLAGKLVETGFPAVLSWADSVYDTDAIAFATAFYGQIARKGMELATAYARARFKLMQPKPGGRVPAHWHQARLFLGPQGGGRLTGGTKPRLPQADAGRKIILDAARGAKIEVANRYDFVGRRRQIQTIRREFDQPSHAGVLIHGLGRQGKSSLAARVLDRYPDRIPIALFQRCDGPSLLDEIARKMAGEKGIGAETAEICRRYRPLVDPDDRDRYDPTALYSALRLLLKGPCRHPGFLLLLDDFEALLDPPEGEGKHRVKPETVPGLAALIRAFAEGETASRLLITSRYQFAFAEDGHDLAAMLRAISLPEMSRIEASKQARQKRLNVKIVPAGFDRLEQRAIAAARGNAGLQDILFRTALAAPATGEATIAALETYLKGGALPAQQELRDTLEHLAIERLVEALSDSERQILLASTLFRLPVPLDCWTGFTERALYGKPDRLIAFGLWEAAPDPVAPERNAVAANAIATARLPAPADAAQIVAALLPTLFTAWGGIDRAKLPYATDIELSRLALLCGDLDVLNATALYAIRGLEREFDYRGAASRAAAALDLLTEAGRPISIDLLRAAAEAFDRVGDAERLARLYAEGADLGADDPTLPAEERLARARFRGRYGAYLAGQGEPDQALQELKAAQQVFEVLGAAHERAVTLGDIARILTVKGEIDEALTLHREQLAICDALGDRRGRAVTLGDIARILTAKGEIDEALTLHRQQIATYEALGDRRSRAVTLGDIARILTAKGEIDEALTLHREQIATYETLGDRRSRAVTLGDIARILTAKGEIDEALTLHREELATYETLGDRRSRAVTLGDIAHILTAKGEIDEALTLHREGLIQYRELGDQEGVANANFAIGRICLGRAVEGQDQDSFQQAYEALDESYRILLQIGRLDGICVVGITLGQLLAMAGETEQARSILTRSLDGFRKLGRPREVAQVEAMLRGLA